MEQWKYVSILDILPLAFDNIECPPSPYDEIRLSAHKSPVHEGLYVIWVCISSTSPSDSIQSTTTTLKYTLLLLPNNPGAPYHLHLRSSISVDPRHLVAHDISYAGHTELFYYFGNRTLLRVLSLPELHAITDDSDGMVDLPGSGGFIHLSAYSGALTYITDDSVVVNYYL